MLVVVKREVPQRAFYRKSGVLRGARKHGLAQPTARAGARRAGQVAMDGSGVRARQRAGNVGNARPKFVGKPRAAQSPSDIGIFKLCVFDIEVGGHRVVSVDGALPADFCVELIERERRFKLRSKINDGRAFVALGLVGDACFTKLKFTLSR